MLHYGALSGIISLEDQNVPEKKNTMFYSVFCLTTENTRMFTQMKLNELLLWAHFMLTDEDITGYNNYTITHIMKHYQSCGNIVWIGMYSKVLVCKTMVHTGFY